MVHNDVVIKIADYLVAIDRPHPIRVVIDGITAVGKTTFADALSSLLKSRSIEVVRVSMDGFHHPRAIRHQSGMTSADSYYENAYDFRAVRELLLNPLGPLGNQQYRTAVIDLLTDEPIAEQPQTVANDSYLILDGSFMQKPILMGASDVVIFLRASFSSALERGVARDARQFGGVINARAAYLDRYHAAQRRYISECNPENSADIVVDVEDHNAPRLITAPFSIQ